MDHHWIVQPPRLAVVLAHRVPSHGHSEAWTQRLTIFMRSTRSTRHNWFQKITGAVHFTYLPSKTSNLFVFKSFKQTALRSFSVPHLCQKDGKSRNIPMVWCHQQSRQLGTVTLRPKAPASGKFWVVLTGSLQTAPKKLVALMIF